MSIDALLSRPAREGVRLRALELLDAARAARVRLDDDADLQAVHDFRVALRRLRSLLKAHAPVLDKRIAKLRRELGDVADRTGAARDAEVQLEWLRAQRVSPARRPALESLVAALEARKAAGYEAVRVEAGPALDALEPRLRRRLSRYRVELAEAGGGRDLAGELASLLVERARALADGLALVRGAADEADAHAARIVGKQLRYLLEPLIESERAGEQAAAAVKALKSLQEVLGELHDAHVMGHVVQQAIVDAASEQARRVGEQVFAARRVPAARAKVRDLRPGLVAVAGLVRERRDGLYGELARRRRRVRALVDTVAEVATRLSPESEGIEIERKYLLSGMPPVDGAETIDIEQGYLPGDRLQERLRRIRAADGSQSYVRGMKLGAGIRRIEVEEPCPVALFKKLWPMTAGKRIRKRRFMVKDGDLIWEIDRFNDFDLVLAEVELPAEDTPVTPPPWLAELIVREVTGDRAFTNEALAR